MNNHLRLVSELATLAAHLVAFAVMLAVEKNLCGVYLCLSGCTTLNIAALLVRGRGNDPPPRGGEPARICHEGAVEGSTWNDLPPLGGEPSPLGGKPE